MADLQESAIWGQGAPLAEDLLPEGAHVYTYTAHFGAETEPPRPQGAPESIKNNQRSLTYAGPTRA